MPSTYAAISGREHAQKREKLWQCCGLSRSGGCLLLILLVCCLTSVLLKFAWKCKNHRGLSDSSLANLKLSRSRNTSSSSTRMHILSRYRVEIIVISRRRSFRVARRCYCRCTLHVVVIVVVLFVSLFLPSLPGRVRDHMHVQTNFPVACVLYGLSLCADLLHGIQ